MAENSWTISVSQLNTYIKNIVDAEEMLNGINVFGEVSNFKVLHDVTYFELKDEGACISCVCFQHLSTSIKNGDKVTVYGKLYFNIKTGKMGFNARRVEPFGIGELYQQYLELKQKLEKEGMFDSSHKKPLPTYVKTIGVVTSTGGAVIKDIIRVVQKKNKHISILVYPSKIQGEGAVDEICKGIQYFNEKKNVDCIILARGGGSFEDFAPFNTEKLARCIYASSLPIISAVGHETDFSISDFVADARAGTPSIAADMAAYDEQVYINYLQNMLKSNYIKLRGLFETLKNKVEQYAQHITLQSMHKYEKITQTVQTAWKNAYDKMIQKIESLKLQMAILESGIEKQNPLALLRKGFAKVQITPYKNLELASVGDVLLVETENHMLKASVTKVEKK